MTKKMQPFWWFIGYKEGVFDVRIFNMRYGEMTYIENALVEIIQDSTVVKSGYTDANGKYATVLGAGTYKIRISKSGYRTIEKTETLAYPSELMVNLPMELAVMGRSGAVMMFVTGEVGNPEITTVYHLFSAPTKKTTSISTVYNVSVV